jgi:hypothetical protein
MLTTEVIEVGGQSLTLGETTLRSDHRRAELLKQASLEASGETLDDLTRWIYPSLVACVISGTPPALEQLADLPLRELALWRETAQRLNPSWFPEIASDANSAEQEKKDS